MAIRLSPEHARAAGITMPSKPNKYGAKRTEYGGISYDSKAEADYAATLALEVLAGRVAWWIRQASVQLGPDFKTKVDFIVATPFDGCMSIVRVKAIEVKGAETREFRKVRELWPKYATIPLHIIKRGNAEVIEGKSDGLDARG